ncbi:MAG: VOC family protein [Isosphaeraceae bacterium]
MGVVETGVYVDDLESAGRFYRDALGLEELGRETDRHVFFRVGTEQVLLLFRAETTLRGEHLPAHGAKGPGHFALGIAADDFEAWRERLQRIGVPIEHEVQWPGGGRSLYFRDPSGNSVELVTPGVWGLPSGW